MQPVRRYLLREYGSWGVMTISYLAGLGISGNAGMPAVAGFFSLCLLINSKQALTLWMRGAVPGRRTSGIVFSAQVAVAAFLLVPLLIGSARLFLPYVIVPLAYLALLCFAGEHHILTEISGFGLLTLSSLIGRYITSGIVDHRLYAAVALFFVAGVFKVRVQFRKDLGHRAGMILYLAAAALLYSWMELPLVALLPLAENLAFSLLLYRISQQATGWTEVGKGLLFLVLLVSSYTGRTFFTTA